MAVGPTRVLWLSIGTLFLVVPFLPLSLGPGADPGPVWWPHVRAWGFGAFSLAVVGVLAGRITAAWRPYRWSRFMPPPRIAVPALVVFLFGAASFAMLNIFSSNPHLVDEIALLFQGRVYASGRLAAPAPQFPEFFLFLNTFVTQQGWVSQYPPGHPALLSVGLLIGLEYLVNPLLAAASVYLVYKLAHQLFGPKTAIVTTVLWVTSGWVIFMSGTYQSHVSATAFALLGWVAVLGVRHISWARALLSGAALGGLVAIRPLDAVAASLPIAVWILHRRQWIAVPAILLGAAPLVAVVALVNWVTFESPTTFGYTALYGAAHGIGFHTDPYGWAFTPSDALRNTFYALRRVNLYLFEWPIPAALPIGLWALLGRQKRTVEIVVAVGVLSLPICYFFYWHSGFYIGPRFWYGITPFLAIGTARAWKWLVHAVRHRKVKWFRTDMALRWSVVALFMWAFMSLLPARARAYRDQLHTAKLHPERQLEQLGVEQALVFVPGSWLSRTVAGLWSAGAPAGLVERAITRLDTCDLDGLLRATRTGELREDTLADSLESMLASPLFVPRVPNAPDPSTRLRRSRELPERCAIELARDYQGFTLYGQFAWHNAVTLDHGIVFARDLFERNDRLLAQYRGWDVWRYAPPPGDPDGEPILTRLRTGSETELAEE